MNIKTQVAILTLLHILPLELRYGHYTVDVILSKLVNLELLTDSLQIPYRDFTIMLYTEVLIILFSLLVPKLTHIYMSFFNQYDHINQPDQIPLPQEKTDPKPATHWLSSVLDLLIHLNILYSLYLVLNIYFSIFMTYLFPIPCCNLVIPFFTTITYHTLLLSYSSLLLVICYNTRRPCSRIIRLLVNFHLCWGFIIRPILNYIKCTSFYCT